MMMRLIHPLSSAFLAIVSSVLLCEVTSQLVTTTNLWTTSISAQPTAIYYSKSEDLVYAFGHNPARVVSMKPDDGSVVEEVNLPTAGSSYSSIGVTRSVTVRESDFRMDFAILNIDEGVGRARIVCWDFYLRLVRWEFNATGLSLPTMGKPAIADDGSMIYQHFLGGEIYALNAFSGEAVWKKMIFPMAGWTYVNGQLYGGILAEAGSPVPGIYHLDAMTGEYKNRWRAPHQCSVSGSMNIASESSVSTGTHANCNNIWSNSIPSSSGEYLYVMDDYFGLMKLETANIAAGPVWSSAFSSDNIQGSQQTYYPPVLSTDGSIIYASAFWTTAAINTSDGSTIWTVSQSGNFLSRDLVLSKPYGEALYVPFNFGIHKIDTATGVIEFETDKGLMNTMVVQSISKKANDRFFAAGVNVHAFATELAPTTAGSVTPAPSPPLALVGFVSNRNSGVATQMNSGLASSILLMLPSASLLYMLL